MFCVYVFVACWCLTAGFIIAGMSGEHVDAIEDQLLHTRELLRPGFTRVGFSYLMSPAEVRSHMHTYPSSRFSRAGLLAER